MTEQQAYQAITTFLKAQKFQDAILFVQQYDISARAIIIGLKIWKNKTKPRPEHKQAFWQSNFPVHFLSTILESDLKTDFLMEYFGRDAYSSDVLNKKFLREYPKLFIRFAKLFSIYRRPAFMKSLDRLTRIPSLMTHTTFVRELERCKQVEDKLNAEEEKDNQLLFQFDLDEILFAWTLRHAALMQDKIIQGNKSLQTREEVATVNEMNRIIHLFHKHNKRSCHFESQEALYHAWLHQEPDHKWLGRKTKVQVVNPSNQLLIDILNRSIERQSDRGLLDLYLSGYADFTHPVHLHALLTNEKMKVFRLNDRKSQIEELYFMDLGGIEAIFNKIAKGKFNFAEDFMLRLGMDKSQRQMDFFGFPKEVKLVDGTILSLNKIIQLLHYFAVFNGPPERLFVNGKFSIMKNKADKKFEALFGANQNITQYPYENLYKNFATYFEWEDREAKQILDFLTTEVGGKTPMQYWVGRPFLRIQENVYWIGRMLKDRHWANILRNRFRDDPSISWEEEKDKQNPIFGNLEKRAASI